MVGLPDILYGILLPALIAGVLLLLGGRGTPLEAREKPVLGALALGIGYLVAHVGLKTWPTSPFGDAQVPWIDWIAWLVVATILLAQLRLVPAFRRWSGPLVIGFACVALEHLILKSKIEGFTAGPLLRFAIVVAWYLVWHSTERLARTSTGMRLPLALVIAGTGLSLCALFSSNMLLAKLTGAVVAGLGAACVVARLDKNFRLPIGSVAIVHVVFGGVLAVAWIYELPLVSVALIVVALLASWIAETKALASRSAFARASAAAVAAALPAAIAVWIAYRASVERSGEYGY